MLLADHNHNNHDYNHDHNHNHNHCYDHNYHTGLLWFVQVPKVLATQDGSCQEAVSLRHLHGKALLLGTNYNACPNDYTQHLLILLMPCRSRETPADRQDSVPTRRLHCSPVL
jgi:hypothetical protein